MNNSTQLNVSVKRTNQKRLYFFIVRYLNLTVSFILYQISRIIFVNNFIKNSIQIFCDINIIHNKRTDSIELLTLHLQWTNWFNRIIQILIDNEQTDSIRSHKYLSVKSVNERIDSNGSLIYHSQWTKWFYWITDIVHNKQNYWNGQRNNSIGRPLIVHNKWTDSFLNSEWYEFSYMLMSQNPYTVQYFRWTKWMIRFSDKFWNEKNEIVDRTIISNSILYT